MMMSPKSSKQIRREGQDYATEHLPSEPKGKSKNKTYMKENEKSRRM